MNICVTGGAGANHPYLRQMTVK